jgi:uncharacterized protein YjeT (DUF2065 family)
VSEEGALGISLAEKFFGFLILVVGIIVLYYTVSSANTLLAFTGFFGFLCLVLVIIGLILMTAKTE